MIPKLNSHVYVVYKSSVTRVMVEYKSREGFAHNECFDPCIIDECRVPLFYKDYKETWFKSLKEVKERFHVRLVKVMDDYWEFKDET